MKHVFRVRIDLDGKPQVYYVHAETKVQARLGVQDTLGPRDFVFIRVTDLGHTLIDTRS